MKKALLTVLVTLVCTIAAANPITRQQALQKATAFMKTQNPLATLNATPVHKAPRRVGAQVSTDQAYYYVFNADDGKGFVIASGDDVAVPILGYSDTSTFNEDEIPDNMRAWLHGYELEIQWAIEHGYQPAPDASSVTAANTIFAGEAFTRDSSPLFSKKGGRLRAPKQDIAYLVKCTWDQGDPYNIQCPQYQGSYSYAGCVATAMAQVMYYWAVTGRNGQTFQHGSTAIPGYWNYFSENDSVKLDNLSSVGKFSWSQMTATKPRTNTAKNAVAQLMRYCGQAVQMEYSPNASGASELAVAPALINYFGYDKGTRYVNHSEYSVSDWEDLIYNELANGRPVILDGVDGPAYSGHEFVCDGYQQSTNTFHINWGWSGSSNNYFALSALAPGGTGSGSSTAEANYSYRHGAVIGIQPPISDDERETTSLDQMSIECLYQVSPRVNTREARSQGVDIRLRGVVFNVQADSMTYDYGLGIYNEAGELIGANDLTTDRLGPGDGLYFMQDFSFGAEIPYGTYKFVPISRRDTISGWMPMQGASAHYVKAVVERDKITVTPSQALKVNSVKSTKNSVQFGQAQTYTNTISVTNDGLDTFTGMCYVLVNYNGQPQLAGFLEPLNLAAGQTANVNMYPGPSGVNLASFNDIFIIGDGYMVGRYYTKLTTYADIEWNATWEGFINSDKQYFSDTYDVTFVVDNVGDNTYNHDVTLTLFEKGKAVSTGTTIKKNMTVPAKGHGEAQFQFPNVKFGTTYDLQFKYYEGSAETTALMSSYGRDLTMTKGIVTLSENGYKMFPDADQNETLEVSDYTYFVDARYSDKASLIGDGGNVNTLYLLKAGTSVPETLAGKNVVLGNTAQNIVMTDTMEFYSPIDFTAQNISFKRTFETGRDETTPHWSTLMLPFDVQSVTTGDKAIDWYHSADDADKEFWLMDFTGETGGKANFSYTSTIEANHPYIVAVPSDTWGNKWNLVGKELTFSGQNAEIKAEGPKAVLDRGGKYDFIGRTILTTHADKYDLNEQGSTFEYITDDYYFYSLPFQAYFVAYTDLGTQSNVELAMPMPLPTPAQTMVGDVNGDETVTIADVTALVNIILGKDDAAGSDAADVNEDGSITIADVTALVNIILGKN